MARLAIFLLLYLAGCAPLGFLLNPAPVTASCLLNEAGQQDGWFALKFDSGSQISLAASRGISSFLPLDVCKTDGPGLSCSPKSFPFVLNIKAKGVVSTYPFDGMDPLSRPETYLPKDHACLK